MQVGATALSRRIYSSERLHKGVLGEILALFPVGGQAIDEVKDQLAILVHETLNRLGGGLGIHACSSLRKDICARYRTILIQHSACTSCIYCIFHVYFLMVPSISARMVVFLSTPLAI